MKKTLALLLALTMIFAFCVGGATASADDVPDVKVNWVFSCTNAADNPSVIIAQEMADRVTERTNGNWTFSFYPASALAGEADAVEMTRIGTVHWIQTTSTYMELYMPEFGALGLPYLFRSWDDQLSFTKDSEFMKDLFAQLEEQTGLRWIGSLNAGARQLVTCGIDPIKCPADLNGAKIRSQQPESRQNMVASLGATPVPMSLDEVYIAMQTGVIDGQENPTNTIWINKFYEITDDLYKTEHNYGEMGYFLNAAAYDALPEEYKAIWDEEWAVLMERTAEAFIAAEGEAEQAIRDSGVRIWEQEDLDMQAFYDSAAAMIEEKYMSDPVWAGVVNAVNEYCGY